MQSMFEEEKLNNRAFDYYIRLRKVREYVGHHYSDTVSLGQAASVACMEPKSFSKFFRQRVGVPFHFWLTHLRICEAKKLIRASDDPITEIAHAVGFEDLRTFERAFRRHSGLSPREFKKSILSPL